MGDGSTRRRGGCKGRSAGLRGAGLRRRGTLDGASAAAARVQPGDLRQGDAAIDDIECSGRILGPGNSVRQRALNTRVPVPVWGGSPVFNAPISVAGGRSIWSALAAGLFALFERTDYASAVRESL